MTIAEPEARVIAAEIPAVPREAAERVVDYLVFHRSLLGESTETPELLERYLTLVKSLKEGVHIVIPDPFQKATALLFELVLEESFDPWEIDLARFTEVYLERVRSEGGVNFAVAGRLLYMAWTILYLQSEELLKARTPAAPLDAEAEIPPEESFLGDLETTEAVDVTTAVLDAADGPPLVPMVRHAGTRPVSLLELVGAFGEAEEEARRSLRIQELRERLREEQRAPPEVLVHGDIPVRDLEDAWALALKHPIGEAFPLLDLWHAAEGRDRLVSLFLAALFLARERAVDLDQTPLGEGPLELIRRLDARPPAVPEG